MSEIIILMWIKMMSIWSWGESDRSERTKGGKVRKEREGSKMTRVLNWAVRYGVV